MKAKGATMTRVLFILSIPMLLLSCAVFTPTEPPSTIGLYGPEPVNQDIPGSSTQALFTFHLPYSSEEVFEAAKLAMLRNGYVVDKADPKSYMVSGSNIVWCGGITMAIYIKQISAEPETEFHILADGYDIFCTENQVSQEIYIIASHIERIVSS